MIRCDNKRLSQSCVSFTSYVKCQSALLAAGVLRCDVRTCVVLRL